MKLQAYIINNLTIKKGRTILMILGIILACNSLIVINLMTENFNRFSTSFFTPFSDYDQIVERGSDYIQLLPISSSIDQNKQIEIEEIFNINTVPCLLISNNMDITSYQSSYIMGLNLEDMPKILDKLQLVSGFWPKNNEQIIVGNNWANDGNLTLYNGTFQIVGSIAPTFTFLDQMIFMALVELQNLTYLPNQLSVIFIPNEIEGQTKLIEEFENNFPQLDLLTIKEMDDIKGGLSSFINNISIVLSSISTISALIFIFSIETINIYNKKKDFDIFVILGTPKKKILGLLLNESIFLISLGLVLGLPLSLFSYSIIWTKVLQSLENKRFITIFMNQIRIIANTLPLKIFFSTSLIIFLCGLVFTIIPGLIALKKYNLGDIKQKY